MHSNAHGHGRIGRDSSLQGQGAITFAQHSHTSVTGIHRKHLVASESHHRITRVQVCTRARAYSNPLWTTECSARLPCEGKHLIHAAIGLRDDQVGTRRGLSRRTTRCEGHRQQAGSSHDNGS
jgi:hypothetical protein